jgi:large subunit ribosomal protein L25
MDRISLKAEERIILGKKVKNLRKDGLIPGNVFGNKVESESVTLKMKDFKPAYDQAGETGLIDLRIGAEKVRPVLIRNIQYDALTDKPLHVDFYQVNLKEKVTVPVPIILKELEEETESVKMGEAIVLQTMSEVEVEALPTDLIEHIEVDISTLKNIDDSISIADLSYNRDTITVLAEPDEIVVKLAPAVSDEMKALMEEQAAETAAASEAAEGETVLAEGETAEGAEMTDESAQAGGGEEEHKEGGE